MIALDQDVQTPPFGGVFRNQVAFGVEKLYNTYNANKIIINLKLNRTLP